MSDYTAVAPPSNLSGGFDPSSAFADALQRARQIAAKINTPAGESNPIGGGTKRPLEDSGMEWSDHRETKKIAAINDPFGAQLAAMQQQQRKAKELIMQIVNRGGTSSATLDPGPLPDGHSMVEMMIPGGKVGLVIGKGGETIKSLQERAGVKMVMIQDGPQQTLHEKPLRITGEPQKCEYARQLVMDLITEKELESMNRGGAFHRNQMGTNEYGTSQTSTQEVTVPRPAVGVVIGKGGDMIKKIQQDSGARVQFQQDDTPGDRICMLTGSPEQISKAQNIIHDLINSIMVSNNARDQQGMGRGRGRGRGFDGRPREFGPGGPGPGPGMGRGGPPGQNRGPNDKQEIQYSVPANKCGIVIGKGGETIRTINQQTGAHVELSRQPPPNPNEKIFIIRGSQQQIEHAKQLINEKIGGPPGPGYPGGPGGPGGPPPGGYPNSNQQPPPPPQAYAPQGWGNAYQHWQNQSATPNDPTKAAADANAAAWAAYYAQYYNQPGGQGQPQNQQPQQPPSQQPPQQPQAQGQGAQAQAGQSQPSQQGAQPDYSAAWAEYYRSLGMFREAEMIEQQARANQQAQAQQQPQAPGVGQPQAQTPQQQQQQQPQQQPYNQQGQQYNQAQQPNQSQPQAQQQFPQYGQYSGGAPGTGTAAAGQYTGQHPAYNYGYGSYTPQQYQAANQ